MLIAVLGAGNGGRALAGDLARLGASVGEYRSSHESPTNTTETSRGSLGLPTRACRVENSQTTSPIRLASIPLDCPLHVDTLGGEGLRFLSEIRRRSRPCRTSRDLFCSR